MIPGSKGLNPHELAHKWMKDLGIRPNMSLKVGWQSHDMRIIGRIVGVQSTEQSVGIIVGAFAPTHKYKCRKVRQFVRVQKWRTFLLPSIRQKGPVDLF